MPFKTIALAFAASLATHVLFVTTLGSPLWEMGDPDNRSVEISYVHYAPEAPSEKVPKIQYLSRPKIKLAEQAERINAPIKESPRFLEVRVADSQVKTSQDLLSDPLKGKIFLNYFGLVKQRVRRAVEKKYSGDHLGQGDVSLTFVLKSDGIVVNIFVVDKNSSADEVMKDFAVRCVKECSPFPYFPKELGMDRISFNLSILFNESR